MASEGQQILSTLIKNVHKTLRDESKLLGSETAWEKHCLNKDNLREYSQAMRNLASFWQDNYKEEQQNCRINWVHKACVEYFENGGIFYQQTRERNIIDKNELVDISNNNPIEEKYIKLKLLDVGSCYNPFKGFNCFDVTAIDIAPASKEVFECDFLKLTVTKNSPVTSDNAENNTITYLSCNSFHVVVFCLLLEYLPTPELRLSCCEKAYKLLRNEGLLLIVTPDSKHVGANAKLMKSWRFVLAKLGFSRIKYEKLKYVHCMAFRKCINSEVAKRWAKIYKDRIVYDKIYIPQDFNTE